MAVRTSAAWSEPRQMSVVRVSGRHAFEALDALCPAELYLRDGQLLSTLLLDDDAHPVADVLVCRVDRDFLLFAEGLDAAGMESYLRDAPEALEFQVADVRADHAVLAVDGPYAWEVVGEMIGPEVIGLPYLSMLKQGGVFCVRAGRTGEFGYTLLVPAADAERLRQRLHDLTPRFDLERAELDALDQCALENWFFNIRREGSVEWATPLELQLQWRVSYRKSFRGAAALAERRRAGIARRLATLVSDDEVRLGDAVMLDDVVVGDVVNAGRSSARGDWVALAFIDAPVSVPGIDFTSASEATLRTISPPTLHNRSLFVSPQLHSYALREESPFPPLRPPDARR